MRQRLGHPEERDFTINHLDHELLPSSAIRNGQGHISHCVWYLQVQPKLTKKTKQNKTKNKKKPVCFQDSRIFLNERNLEKPVTENGARTPNRQVHMRDLYLDCEMARIIDGRPVSERTTFSFSYVSAFALPNASMRQGDGGNWFDRGQACVIQKWMSWEKRVYISWWCRLNVSHLYAVQPVFLYLSHVLHI